MVDSQQSVVISQQKITVSHQPWTMDYQLWTTSNQLKLKSPISYFLVRISIHSFQIHQNGGFFHDLFKVINI